MPNKSQLQQPCEIWQYLMSSITWRICKTCSTTPQSRSCWFRLRAHCTGTNCTQNNECCVIKLMVRNYDKRLVEKVLYVGGYCRTTEEGKYRTGQDKSRSEKARRKKWHRSAYKTHRPRHRCTRNRSRTCLGSSTSLCLACNRCRCMARPDPTRPDTSPT